MANSTVLIYDRSRVILADLPEAYQVAVTQRLNEVGTASFLLPLDDSHVADVQLLYYAEIWDGDTRQDLYRIVKRSTVRTDSATYYRYDCEHVFGMLRDDKLAASLAPTVGTTVAINAVLALQGTANWTLGTCGFTEAYLYAWKKGTSLLTALLEIPERFKADYQWTWDTSTYPWTLNLIVPPTEPTAFIDYGRNLKGITKVEDATRLATRLYAYGAGAGAGQLTIASQNITGATEAITAPAAAGQKNVTVHVGASFVHGDHVYISDGTLWENNEVDSVAGNVLTMVSNLLQAYTVAGSVSEAEQYIDAASLATYGLIVKHWTDQRYTTAATLYASAIDYLAWLSSPPTTYSIDAAELYRITSESIDRFTLGALVGVKDHDLGIDVEVRIVCITKSGLDEAPGNVRIELANKLGEFVFTGYVETNDLSGIDIHDIPGGEPGALPGVPAGDGIWVSQEFLGFYGSGAWKSFLDHHGNFYLGGVAGALQYDAATGTLSITASYGNLGDLPAMAATPGAAGLYLNASYIGYWTGAAWNAYIKNDGSFKFAGNAANYMQWDGATFTLVGTFQASGDFQFTYDATKYWIKGVEGISFSPTKDLVNIGFIMYSGAGDLSLFSGAASTCDLGLTAGGRIVLQAYSKGVGGSGGIFLSFGTGPTTTTLELCDILAGGGVMPGSYSKRLKVFDGANFYYIPIM